VREIHDLSSINEWHHIGTKDNPADIISRVCSAKEIINSSIWWYGPSWLTNDHTNWPNTVCQLKYTGIPEEKGTQKTAALLAQPVINEKILSNYSSWNRLLRIFCYCLRFIKIRIKKMKVVGPILADELKEAEIVIIKITQASYWSSEINDLNKNGTLTVKSKLHNLQPFLESGIIRVGGRIKNARHVEIAQRHPILIPKNSTIARLILLNEHDRLLHAGPQAMLANSRLKYWIIRGRNIARHVFHQCVKCF
jgi:hypothetical protein